EPQEDGLDGDGLGELLAAGERDRAPGLSLGRSPRVHDIDVAVVAGFTSLRALNVGGVPLSAATLKTLAAARTLEVLALTMTGVGDAELKSLAASKSIKVLYLDQTGVTDAGLDALPDVRELSLAH